jgi:hypothetical protein
MTIIHIADTEREVPRVILRPAENLYTIQEIERFHDIGIIRMPRSIPVIQYASKDAKGNRHVIHPIPECESRSDIPHPIPGYSPIHQIGLYK